MNTGFDSVSIILPVMDETISLVKTVEIIMQNSAIDVKELIIVFCDQTTNESLQTISSLKQKYEQLIVIHKQILPFVGGAIREAFALSRASHVILMATDLETDPKEVPQLIAQAKLHPQAIITASRWLKGGGFSGYNKVKLVANWFFQKFFSTLYCTKLTDMTYAYRLFPTELVQKIKWQELKHPFFLETLVKPLRLNTQIIEIPTSWSARVEGHSHNTALRNFDYIRIGFQTRFAPVASIVKEAPTSNIGSA